MKKYSLVLISFLLLLQACNNSKKAIATVKEKKQYSDTAWIAMMDNPGTNYNDAVENFENYWKDKRKPVEEGELFEKAESGKDVAKTNNTNEPATKYYFEYKKFKHWQNDIRPYVQPDGHIPTMDEIIEMHKQQQEIRKRQPLKN